MKIKSLLAATILTLLAVLGTASSASAGYLDGGHLSRGYLDSSELGYLDSSELGYLDDYGQFGYLD
ncbi:MAG: hypothetical protein CSA58_01035 [Micrococcales bacterium]|nr:MAG: hypothetical protein CSB46_02615 [Micrococcales bacterium]PIE28067.1 MAG: hypothetical protein CSA58_01035 [Micrococcales bacterium]